MEQVFPGVWREGKKILTRNLAPGKGVYGEELIKVRGMEYREWVPDRSKPAAAVLKGLKTFPVKRGSVILYLGAASGTTVSHFSDIVGREGIIYAVEISERSLRDLNHVAEIRGNIVPVLADARLPENYRWVEKTHVLYQDVATPDQPEILIRNAGAFLNRGGFAMLAVKSRSIDVTREPGEVYREVERKLRRDFEILEKIRLDPYQKDHMLFVLKYPAKG